MEKLLEERLASLRLELSRVRKSALHATRRCDYMEVARMTARAQKINREIFDIETQKQCVNL